MTTYHSDSAFPLHPDLSTTSPDGFKIRESLTKREYIASQILAGLAAGNTSSGNEWLVTRAVTLADKLIVELNKPTQ